MGGYSIDYSSMMNDGIDPNTGLPLAYSPAQQQPYTPSMGTPLGGYPQQPLSQGGASYFDPAGAPQGYSQQPFNNDYASTGITWGAPNSANGTPNGAMLENRALAYNSGTQLLQGDLGQQNYQTQLQNYYGGAMNSAYGSLQAQPGYSQSDINSMQGAVSGLGPTAQETAAMQGTPSYADYLNSGATQSNNAIGSETGGIQTALGNESSGLGSALSGASTGAYGALSGESSGIGGYLNPNKLSLNLDPNNYLMSDAEKQGIVNQAGESAHLSRQNDEEQMMQQAMAGGNADWQALAAMKNRYENNANVEGANAMTNASLAADAQQRGLAMNYAQANLGANQQYAGMGIGSQEQLGQQGINTALNIGQMGQQNAEIVGQQGIQSQESLGQQGIGEGQYIGSQGTGILEAQDQAAAQRAASLYGIRNANTQYGVGLTQNIANTGLAGQQQFRNWATGQTNASTQAAQGWGSQAQGAQTGINNALSTASGQWAGYDAAKGNQGFANAFSNALGGTLGKGLGTFYTAAAAGS